MGSRLQFCSDFFLKNVCEFSYFVIVFRNRWEDGSFEVPLVGPTIKSNKEISVEYFVRIGVKRKCGSDLYVDLPVFIGTKITAEDVSNPQSCVSLTIPSTVDTTQKYNSSKASPDMFFEKEILRTQLQNEETNRSYHQLILERIE